VTFIVFRHRLNHSRFLPLIWFNLQYTGLIFSASKCYVIEYHTITVTHTHMKTYLCFKQEQGSNTWASVTHAICTFTRTLSRVATCQAGLLCVPWWQGVPHGPNRADTAHTLCSPSNRTEKTGCVRNGDPTPCALVYPALCPAAPTPQPMLPSRSSTNSALSIWRKCR
jgi:hypothetical protein